MYVSQSELESSKKKVVPQNTEKSTQWAIKTFTEWAESRKESGREAPPSDILLMGSAEAVCDTLCLFFSEIRQANGNPYTPRSLSYIMGGLQRYINDNSPHPLKIQQSDGEFKPLHTCLENLYVKLHEQGVSTAKVQADVITLDEEQQLWESGVYNTQTPEGLLNAVFYYNGVNFILRGGEEHRSLKLLQFVFGSAPDPEVPGKMLDYVDYTEHGSKNRPGGSKQLNLESKMVHYYAQLQLGDCCHVSLLKLYISKLPPSLEGKDIFYCKPLKVIKNESQPWFTAVPIGHNTLSSKLKSIFTEAELSTENKSNHSLRATAISRMYRASVPEKVIMERSGHLTKEGVRSYE